MKVFLLHAARDVEFKPELQDPIYAAMMSGNPWALQNARRDLDRTAQRAEEPAAPGADDDLARDLDLDILWRAMADGDGFIYETARRVVLSSLTDPVEIRFRQQVLGDVIDHADVVRRLYDLAMEGLENERSASGMFWHSETPEMTVRRCVSVLTLHLDVLRRLRRLADEQAGRFRSRGFTRFFAMVGEELTDDYLAQLDDHLHELTFSQGIHQSARLGRADKGLDYVVHRAPERRWLERLGLGRDGGYSFTIPPRDEAGAHALSDLRSRGLAGVADAVAQGADHVKAFFTMLRLELAFYLGALNLHDLLIAKGEPICFPEPAPAAELALAAEGLYDVCLTLRLRGRAVGNRISADGIPLVVITGANQGGKSTLLRGIGLAHLMMQAGLVVGAETFRASVRSSILSHFTREEDATMSAGKLDEELARMSRVADTLGRDGLLLCNESFSSTNEREGSEIARHVIDAMLDSGIRVGLVTHMYDLAHGLHEQRGDEAVFLRAARGHEGRRTYRVTPGEPLPTSYGLDSYRRIFGADPAATSQRPSSATWSRSAG